MYDIFEDIDDFFSNVPRRAIARSFAPAVNVRQTENEVIVETPLPGIDPDKVEITIENDVLTIQYKEEKKSEVEEKEYARYEWSTQSVHRTVALPVAVLGDEADATYDKGVLNVTVPKREEAKAKKVSVKVKK
jgi:HSP20 family protein